MVELLAPAGDYNCALQALYNGCDAIYLATSNFGARAYAKNLTLDEIKRLLVLAHELNKKIYVTVNTILNDEELENAKKLCNDLYVLGVDGLILADYGLINYCINNLPNMEAHMSTQVGIKDLDDVLFFERLGADRCVIARETSLNAIKEIKHNSRMSLEVFAHGALCVSYSGGCLMSSLLTLRSGNRGRCSQNCRREYKLFENDKLIDKGFMLSMKDLNTSNKLSELLLAGIDSLKLEGRMKNPDYVKIITSEYRKKIDNPKYNLNMLEKVFHRSYTKGFVLGEDNSNVVDITKKNNEGELIGEVSSFKGDFTAFSLKTLLHIGDRIKIENGPEDYYFTVDKMYNDKLKETNTSSSITYLNIFKKMKLHSKVYRMIDSSINLEITNKYKKPITVQAIGVLGEPLILQTKIDNKKYVAKSSEVFSMAKSKPIDYDTLFKQVSKLNETSYYLDNLINNVSDDLFMSVASINEARRNLVNQITIDKQNARILDVDEKIEKINYDFEDIEITCFCTNKEQFDACRKENIKYIYFDNTYYSYVNPKASNECEYVLIGSYGGFNHYKDNIITDYSFNVLNAKAVYDLHNAGAKYVTLSVESSFNNLKNLYDNYSKYGNNPNLEMIVYGRINLMTLKYCPLKKYGYCGKCNKSQFYICDEQAKFPIYHEGCITHIVNEKPLNLIDEINKITPYVKRLRLQFSIEDAITVSKVIKNFKNRLKGANYDGFDSKNETRCYFKREIL